MSRRSYDKDYIEWLKSIGLVFWLPLSSDGDLTEVVSGQQLQLTGNGSFVFDSTEGMYKLTNPSTYLDVAKIKCLDALDFQNNEYTTMVTAKKITSQSGSYALFMTIGNELLYISSINYNATSLTSSLPAGVHKYATTLSSVERNLYFDGSINRTVAAYEPYMPSHFPDYTVHIGAFSSSHRNLQIYIKDYMIFNRVLTTEEIRKVQGYE